MITDFKPFTENHKKVLNILFTKRCKDELNREKDCGWLSTKQIKEQGCFVHSAAITGCLVRFMKEDIVENIAVGLPNGGIARFYRLTDDFWDDVKDMIDVIEVW